jgi:hypothetical protein
MFPIAKPLFLRVRSDLLGDLSPTTWKLNGQPQGTAPVIAGSLGIDAVVRF